MFLSALRRESPAGIVLIAAGVDPTTADERDGYRQRVKAIDEALAAFSRVYLIFHPVESRPSEYTSLGNRLWRVELAERDPDGVQALRRLAHASRGIYVHSVFQFASETLRQLISLHSTTSIFDVHGVVPEECEMAGDPRQADLFGSLEQEAYRTVQRVVCVSSAMSAHLAQKYGPTKHSQILLPVFAHMDEFDIRQKSDRPKPTIIYAGGTQVWQRVPQMLDLVASTKDSYNYIFMTPNISEIISGLLARNIDLTSGSVALSSGSRSEVIARYPHCDFGLLLRDDHIVNRVACPTKLIEYLHFGIIPVIESAEIGDFMKFGVKYIHVSDIARGAVPDHNQRRTMALENLEILRRMLQVSGEGKKEIRAVLRDATA